MTRQQAPLIAVVDYGMGNRRSVEKALEHVGARTTLSSDHDTLLQADGLVVPGVGAFPLAMSRLRELGLIDLLRERVDQRTPLLGICLGMQLLFDRSEELGETDGLGLIRGVVSPLRTGRLRVPHIGWNDARFDRPSPLTAELPERGCPFYHVHSFAVRPADGEVVVATAEYGERFSTVVAHGSVFGVQFHPEKSSLHGLQMLANFTALCAERSTARGEPARA